MTMPRKLKLITSETPSTWMAGVEYRQNNRKWLNYSSQIGRRVLAAMRENGITKEELSQKSSLSVEQINNLVKGHYNICLTKIANLSDILGVELICFPEYKYSETLPTTI